MVMRVLFFIVFLSSYAQTEVNQQIVQISQDIDKTVKNIDEEAVKEFIEETKNIKKVENISDDVRLYYGEFANDYKSITNIKSFSLKEKLTKFLNFLNKYLEGKIKLWFTDETVNELTEIVKNYDLNKLEWCNNLFKILNKFIPKGTSEMDSQFKILVKQMMTETIIGQSAIEFSNLNNYINEVWIKYEREILEKMKDFEIDTVSEILTKIKEQFDDVNGQLKNEKSLDICLNKINLKDCQVIDNAISIGSERINKQISLLEQEMKNINKKEEELKEEHKFQSRKGNSTIKTNSPTKKTLKQTIERVLSIYNKLKIEPPNKYEQIIKINSNTYEIVLKEIEKKKNKIKNEITKAKEFQLLSLRLEKFYYLNKVIYALYIKIVHIEKRALDIEELKISKDDGWEELLDLALKKSEKDKKGLNRIESWPYDRVEAMAFYDIVKKAFKSVTELKLNKFSPLNFYYNLIVFNTNFPVEWIEDEIKIFNDTKLQKIDKFEVLIRVYSFRVILAYERLNKIFNTFDTVDKNAKVENIKKEFGNKPEPF